MPSPPSSRSSALRLLGRGLLVSVALLALAEGATRLWLTSPSAQQFDPDLGWRWRPGVVAANYSEGGAPFVANSLGFNDDEVGPKDKPRVVAYGNSFLEAIQVPRAQNYTSLVEASGFEIVNLGRSAMGPPHYPITERVVGRALEPDLTLVHLGEGDLMFMITPEVKVKREGGALVSVDFPVLAKDQLKARLGFILDRSALATYLMRRLKPVIGRWFDLKADAKPPASPSESELAAQREEAYERLVFVLRALRAHGPVLVMNAPSLRYTTEGAERANPWQGPAYARAAAAAGAQYLDAGPALIHAYTHSGQPAFGFQNLQPGIGHLNTEGHRIVAEVLRAYLEKHPP